MGVNSMRNYVMINFEITPKVDRICLGGEVYAFFDGHAIVITSKTDLVSLEPYHMTELLKYIEAIKDEI